MSDITGGNLSDYMLLPLEPQKDSIRHVLCSSNHQHTLMFKLVELPFNVRRVVRARRLSKSADPRNWRLCALLKGSVEILCYK